MRSDSASNNIVVDTRRDFFETGQGGLLDNAYRGEIRGLPKHQEDRPGASGDTKDGRTRHNGVSDIATILPPLQRYNRLFSSSPTSKLCNTSSHKVELFCKTWTCKN
ncbi:unnamed protein product [Chondrus crispus]|uniref:Uncharacterized protein n=1 Tax=Chondrus crispus TaxID=2769 RepID=R7QF90_CHOCR|nr:unnamed protein product [Chondrus crispus]CDF37192.1 unnamed protein product [Chondrus crispus]|eukprot:XP_005717011.1 unnamed protein product [Chondrus crispus]